MKSMHEFFARLFSSQIENPKIKFTSTDSVKLRLFSDFGASETRDFVEDHITFQISSKIKNIIKREI